MDNSRCKKKKKSQKEEKPLADTTGSFGLRGKEGE